MHLGIGVVLAGCPLNPPQVPADLMEISGACRLVHVSAVLDTITPVLQGWKPFMAGSHFLATEAILPFHLMLGMLLLGVGWFLGE